MFSLSNQCNVAVRSDVAQGGRAGMQGKQASSEAITNRSGLSKSTSPGEIHTASPPFPIDPGLRASAAFLIKRSPSAIVIKPKQSGANLIRLQDN